MDVNNQLHWDEVYRVKEEDEMSWTQRSPETSLQLIDQLGLPYSASIIDVGAGNSRLAESLLNKGYRNIAVLDISKNALEKSKSRLGNRAQHIDWINIDVTHFVSDKAYDLWHDRATFHFLTSGEEIERYRDVAEKATSQYMIISTFSHKGPDTCSGLSIRKYDEDELDAVFNRSFEKVNSFTEDHVTPWGRHQNFLFCTFKRRN